MIHLNEEEKRIEDEMEQLVWPESRKPTTPDRYTCKISHLLVEKLLSKINSDVDSSKSYVLRIVKYGMKQSSEGKSDDSVANTFPIWKMDIGLSVKPWLNGSPRFSKYQWPG